VFDQFFLYSSNTSSDLLELKEHGAGRRDHMPRIRIDLDEETYSALMQRAHEERRPLQWEAEVLIRQALGLPFPYPSVIDVPASSTHEKTMTLPAAVRAGGGDYPSTNMGDGQLWRG
jgi:hypothetical protein